MDNALSLSGRPHARAPYTKSVSGFGAPQPTLVPYWYDKSTQAFHFSWPKKLLLLQMPTSLQLPVDTRLTTHGDSQASDQARRVSQRLEQVLARATQLFGSALEFSPQFQAPQYAPAVEQLDFDL